MTNIEAQAEGAPAPAADNAERTQAQQSAYTKNWSDAMDLLTSMSKVNGYFIIFAAPAYPGPTHGIAVGSHGFRLGAACSLLKQSAEFADEHGEPAEAAVMRAAAKMVQDVTGVVTARPRPKARELLAALAKKGVPLSDEEGKAIALSMVAETLNMPVDELRGMLDEAERAQARKELTEAGDPPGIDAPPAPAAPEGREPDNAPAAPSAPVQAPESSSPAPADPAPASSDSGAGGGASE